MKDLTDAVLLNELKRYNFTGFVSFITLFIIVIIIFLILYIFKKKYEKNNTKNLKRIMMLLLFVTIIPIFFCLINLSLFISSKCSEDNWHVSITNVNKKNQMGKSNYYVKLNGIFGYVKVSKKEYIEIRNNDSVYVLIKGDNLGIKVWKLNNYKYTGKRLK